MHTPPNAVPDITLVGLGPDRLPEAHRLSRQEAWPHRPEDWAFLLSLSQGIGALRGGQLVGSALLTPYGADAATCNMIIVDPVARGMGLGRRLMERLLDIAGPRETRLIATASGLPLYEKLGFRATGHIRQFQGVVTGALMPQGTDLATPDDLPALIALDRAAIGMDRTVLLKRLAGRQPFTVLRDGTGLRGYLSCRSFGRGHLAGPIIARTDTDAAVLLQAALARHRGQFLRIDLTEAGSVHETTLLAAGLAHAGDGIAMTRPGVTKLPAAAGATVHALAAQALC